MSKSEEPTKDEDEIKNENSEDQRLTIKKPVRFQELEIVTSVAEVIQYLSRSLANIKVPDYSEMFKNIKVPDYSEMFENIKVPDYSEMFKNIKVPDYSEMLANIQSLDGVKLVFDNWAKTNVQLFDIINKRISFVDRIDSRILPVLKNYNWFITVSLDDAFILNLSRIIEKPPSKLSKAIRQEYINYFSKNNYHKLASMIGSWEQNPLFKPRMKIFRDSYNLLKHSNNSYNPSNLLIPTLIPQIDGILTDYLIQNQFNVVKEGRGLVWKDKLSNNICKVSNRNKIYEKIFDPDFSEYSLTNDSMSKVALEIGNDFILNTLFQTAYTKQKLKKPFGLNRHKIMHGEYVNYGRNDHLIRSYLILDFLYGLEDVDYN
jgi:hypothetical protein